MASTNPYTSFTISQAFLGAPLEFQPPLGSPEFQELINAYVTGSASKQDKISQVTLDFYKNATVDLNTGALVRTYVVYPSPWTGYASFEQSPTQSFSSGYSPIYTPSPASSATFGDSTYGSMSMTPPNPTQGARGRVTKKAKKDTPKAAEARLPGFSIMTKDGIDVTNSAGRGTKTKEQREHAHLMRIMKACDACKKKKIRCDPSHRRSHNDMSRTASTSTQQTSSSGRLDPSPPASTPSLSRVTTHTSQGSLPFFSPSNPIDDFVLFPEDDSSWNSLETQDLGNFNFDINVDLNDPLFDFSFDQQPSGQSSQVGYTPAMNDQNGLGQWAEPQGFQPVSHSRPHPASSANLSRNSSTNTSMNSSMNNSGELDANWQSGWLQAESLISPRTSTSATNYWAGSAENPLLPQGFISCDLNHLDAPNWSLFESTMADGSSPDSTGDATNNELAEASQLSSNRKRRAESSQPQTPCIGPIDPSDQQGFERLGSPAVINSQAGSAGHTQEISRLQNAAQLVSKSLRRIKRAPAEYVALGEELQQLEGALARLQSSQHAETILSSSDSMTLQSVRAQLEALSPSGLEQSRFPANRRRNNLSQGMRPDHARELQVTVRRLIRSLGATTNGLAALQFTSSTLDNHLQPLTRSHHERPTVASSSILQTSGSISSDGFYSMILQNTPGDLLPQGIAGSRPIQRIVQTEQDISSRSDSNRLASPLSSTPLPDAAYQGTSRLNVLLEEQRSGLGTSQHVQLNSGPQTARLPLADHALGHEDRHGVAKPLPAHNRADTQAVSLNNRIFESSPMTTVTQEPSSLVREERSSAVLQTAPTSLFQTYFSFAGALAILGSVALTSSITSGLNISAHLPYLIPLLALSLLIPGQHRTSLLTPALIAGSFLLISSFTSLGLQSVRTACIEWVGNDPFSATAKLLLVAALISSELLSSVNLSVIVVAAVNYLSGTRDACSSGTAVRVSRGHTSEDVNGQGNYASWLGMMDMLSPVVTV